MLLILITICDTGSSPVPCIALVSQFDSSVSGKVKKVEPRYVIDMKDKSITKVVVDKIIGAIPQRKGDYSNSLKEHELKLLE